MPQPKVTVFKRDTNLRSGGSTRGPNNLLEVLGLPAVYVALEQCTGQDVVEGDDRNFWWVRMDTGTRTGWVSAVRIKEGGNDEPVPGVPQSPTRFAGSATS